MALAVGTIHLILIAKLLRWNGTVLSKWEGGRRPHYKGWLLEEEYHLLCCDLCEKGNSKLTENGEMIAAMI